MVEGTVDVRSGAYVGTKGYNTPPTISSALTASITYSNDKYRKRSTVRYDDLVFWYPFDETSGSIAEDYSNHERNATLMNMSGANRIAGKSGVLYLLPPLHWIYPVNKQVDSIWILATGHLVVTSLSPHG